MHGVRCLELTLPLDWTFENERPADFLSCWADAVVFAIFFDSWLFVFVTAILKFGVGLNTSFGVCQGAILLCLVCE